jgi:hypothetical protein
VTWRILRQGPQAVRSSPIPRRGFVIQFLVSSIAEDGKTMILDSERNENIPKDMRSRETYKILNDNEFTETYEIAEPGKDFVVYWVKHFRRKTQ